MDASSTLANDPSNGSKPKHRLFDLSHGILFAAILLSLLFLILLSNDNIHQRTLQSRLRSELATLNGRLSGPPQAQVGDIVPSFAGLSVSGKTTKVSYNGESNYLLFFMSLDCDACLSQIPIWNSIVEEIDSNECLPLGLVSGKSVTVPAASFDLVTLPSTSVQRAYRVVALPMVMVVSGSGTVKWVHYGNLTEDLRLGLLSAIKEERGGTP